ncbi:uncharacterized protein [Typha latifolia]|uniref:uncharacterized protein n=1 Tax=Typha latifolia TaxID=4733 RepID=UPI003C2C5FB3
MQAARNAIRLLRASSPRPSAVCGGEGGLLYAVGSRAFSQPAVACPALEKQEVTDRLLDLLRSIPSIDPSKVSPTASFKNDMQLDMLDNVDVMVAVEEEFAVDIPNSEAAKISTTAHLIDYIAGHPQAK